MIIRESAKRDPRSGESLRARPSSGALALTNKAHFALKAKRLPPDMIGMHLRIISCHFKAQIRGCHLSEIECQAIGRHDAVTDAEGLAAGTFWSGYAR